MRVTHGPGDVLHDHVLSPLNSFYWDVKVFKRDFIAVSWQVGG